MFFKNRVKDFRYQNITVRSTKQNIIMVNYGKQNFGPPPDEQY